MTETVMRTFCSNCKKLKSQTKQKLKKVLIKKESAEGKKRLKDNIEKI